MSEFVWEPLDGGDVDIHEDPDSVVTPLLGVKRSLEGPGGSDVVVTEGPMFDQATEIIETIRPYVKSDGGDVRVLGIRDCWVQLKFEGNCTDCGASSGTLIEIEQAICEEMPDAKGVEVIQE